jgi:hypothetical protein
MQETEVKSLRPDSQTTMRQLGSFKKAGNISVRLCPLTITEDTEAFDSLTCLNHRDLHGQLGIEASFIKVV